MNTYTDQDTETRTEDTKEHHAHCNRCHSGPVKDCLNIRKVRGRGKQDYLMIGKDLHYVNDDRNGLVILPGEPNVELVSDTGSSNMAIKKGPTSSTTS